MNYYGLKIKHLPRTWEKYSIMDANPELEMFTRWYLTTRGLKDDEIVIETTDQDILMFAMAHGEEFRLKRLDAAQMEAIKHKRQANDFLARWSKKEQNEGFYDGTGL
jgi:hypothetical protein